MTEDLTRLQDLTRALARRERVLLLWQTAARALGLGAAVALGAIAAMWLDVAQPRAVAGLVLLGGIGGWVLLAWPLLVRWGPAADPLRQARLLEARDPSLRGRLLTAIGHPDGPRGAESRTLLALVARRAWARVKDVQPGAVHPGDRLKRWAAASVTAWVVVVAVSSLAPGGGAGVWRWWFGGGVADAAVARVDGEVAEATAQVGDLTLRYVYPDYTGLEPYVVANSTGEAHAPPGTRVEVVARSREVVGGASIVAYDEAALEAQVEEGRTVRGAFVVRPEVGTYRIVTQQGGEARSSRAFPIVPEPDLPPEVTLEADAEVLEIPVDEQFPLQWTARDDYGIAEVVLEIDGKTSGVALRRPRGREADVGGQLVKRPKDLGLVPGDSVELVVAATDNDTVSGAKTGRSSVIRLVVLGEDGVARLTAERRDELLDLLVDLLADHLEDTFPPGRSSGAYARWGEQVNHRYEPLSDFLETYRSPRANGPEWRVLEDALTDGLTLIRYSQTSFFPGATEVANGASVTALTDFRERAIESTEQAVLHLDGLRQAELVGKLAEAAETLAFEAEDLARVMAAESPDRQEVYLSLDNLDRYLEGLRADAEQLRPGGLKEIVSSRAAEAAQLSEDGRAAVVAGDDPEARKLLERMADRLDELSEGIREELQRRMDDAQGTKDAAADLLQMLRELEQAQLGLAGEVLAAREELGEGFRERITSLWDRIEQAAIEVADGIIDYRDALERSGREFNEVTNVEVAIEQAEDLVDGAMARDLAGLSAATRDLSGRWFNIVNLYNRLLERGRVHGPPGRREQAVIEGDIAQLQDLLEQLRRLDAAGDPSVREAVQQVQAPQEELHDDLGDARADAKRLLRELPVTPRDLEPALERADDRMDQAGQQLQRGEGMQAQGSQQAAAHHIAEAIEALRRAMEQAGQQAQEMQSGGQGGQPSDEAGDEGSRPDQGSDSPPGPASFDLPEPEEFRTPEDYRRALLLGMEADVPEEYRSLKRRYYEELVHQ